METASFSETSVTMSLDTESYLRRLESSSTPLWGPWISQIKTIPQSVNSVFIFCYYWVDNMLLKIVPPSCPTLSLTRILIFFFFGSLRASYDVTSLGGLARFWLLSTLTFVWVTTTTRGNAIKLLCVVGPFNVVSETVWDWHQESLCGSFIFSLPFSSLFKFCYNSGALLSKHCNVYRGNADCPVH